MIGFIEGIGALAFLSGMVLTAGAIECDQSVLAPFAIALIGAGLFAFAHYIEEVRKYREKVSRKSNRNVHYMDASYPSGIRR